MSDGFRWNDWNVELISDHGISPDEAEYLIDHARAPYPAFIGDGKWRIRGQTAVGRYLQIIFIFDPADIVYVIHARGLSESEKRTLRRRMR